MRRGMRRRAGIGLLGATVVAGGAYAAGSSRQQNAYREQSQEQRINELEAQQASAPPPPAPVAAAPPPAAAPVDRGQERIKQFQQLAELKGQGILTDEEFEREKARILT